MLKPSDLFIRRCRIFRLQIIEALESLAEPVGGQRGTVQIENHHWIFVILLFSLNCINCKDTV